MSLGRVVLVVLMWEQGGGGTGLHPASAAADIERVRGARAAAVGTRHGNSLLLTC